MVFALVDALVFGLVEMRVVDTAVWMALDEISCKFTSAFHAF